MPLWRQFGRKWPSNPMEIPPFSQQMPWNFHDLFLSKIHVTFDHGNKSNLDGWRVIVNSHRIGCQFWWQTAVNLWHGISMRIQATFFLKGRHDICNEILFFFCRIRWNKNQMELNPFLPYPCFLRIKRTWPDRVNNRNLMWKSGRKRNSSRETLRLN